MFTQIDHLAIAVKNLDESMRLYTGSFRLECSSVETIEDLKTQIAFIPVGEVLLELLQPTEPASDIDKFIREKVNLTEVMWALSTRVRSNLDVIEIPGCPGLLTNPADLEPRLGRKLIIDATTPVPPDKIRDNKVVFTDPKVEDWKRIIMGMRNSK